MKTIKIEVTPRSAGDEYHACLCERANVWDAGSSLEGAVAQLLIGQASDLKLPADSIHLAIAHGNRRFSARTSLRNLINLFLQHKIKVDIRFLADRTR